MWFFYAQKVASWVLVLVLFADIADGFKFAVNSTPIRLCNMHTEPFWLNRNKENPTIMYAEWKAVPLKKKPCNDENHCVAFIQMCFVYALHCTVHSRYTRLYVNNKKTLRLCNAQIKQMTYAVTIDRMVTIWIGVCLCHSFIFNRMCVCFSTRLAHHMHPPLFKHAAKRQQQHSGIICECFDLSQFVIALIKRFGERVSTKAEFRMGFCVSVSCIIVYVVLFVK